MYEHIFSKGHIKSVQSRKLWSHAQSVNSVSAKHGLVKAVPEMIRQGACIATVQASLPFTTGIEILKDLYNQFLAHPSNLLSGLAHLLLCMVHVPVVFFKLPVRRLQLLLETSLYPQMRFTVQEERGLVILLTRLSV